VRVCAPLTNTQFVSLLLLNTRRPELRNQLKYSNWHSDDHIDFQEFSKSNLESHSVPFFPAKGTPYLMTTGRIAVGFIAVLLPSLSEMMPGNQGKRSIFIGCVDETLH
jgi:hypothetical protein